MDTQVHGPGKPILKQADAMLVADRTAFAKNPIECLVTLDKALALLEGTPLTAMGRAFARRLATHAEASGLWWLP